MRKIVAIGFMAVVAILGLSVSAKAAPLSPHGVNCAWAPADPTCPTTQPGTPGGCTPTSFAKPGGCVTDTLSFTSRTRGHDWNWDGRNQDPCIFHQHKGLQSQDRFRNVIDSRGCRCQIVKIWHTKVVWHHGCKKEIWYYTTEVICRGHHRDPHHCGCQQGGQVTAPVRAAA